MRLALETHDQLKAKAISNMLSVKGIENELDIVPNTDWGSDEYGSITARLWVIEEDVYDRARQLIESFESDAPKVEPSPPFTPQIKSGNEEKSSSKPTFGGLKLGSAPFVKHAPVIQRLGDKDPLGFLTIGILLTCTILFLICDFTEPEFEKLPVNLPYTPLFDAPIKKDLLYDYPEAYTLVDKLVRLYGLEALQTPANLPPEGQWLLQQYYHTPYWKGIYPKLVAYFKNTSEKISFDEPLFEKIRQGEFWRAYSPCFLHSDIFHLIFNMIWLVVLGRQLELRLGAIRYTIFILVAAIFSNTVQYLVSGSNFIGFSGVLCAMIAYIWMRQKTHAWEGYYLQPSSMSFIMIFIFIMFGIQLISFFLEIFDKGMITLGIANAAHLSGLLIGLLMAKTRLFKSL